MRTATAVLLVALFGQSDSARLSRTSGAGAAPCVPTEPMPVFAPSVRSSESMPIVRPDSTHRLPMPIAYLRPCYSDSASAVSRLQRLRGDTSRARVDTIERP